MKEEFLHYLWKYQLFENQDQLNYAGQELKVMHPGEHNQDAGPDFFNTKIKIGGTIWAGNVEIHSKASDWHKHGHSNDSAYDNVILHVVAFNDEPILRKNGNPIPAIEIASPVNMQEQYAFLMNSRAWVPCENFIENIDAITLLQWKERLLVERLQEKSQIIHERYQQSGNNFEETFYQSLAANMGFKTNGQPFELLSKSLPINYLAKHKDELPLLEAMLFGQSGLIPDKVEAEYVLQLQNDYHHLKNKFQLKSIESHLWKFMRMRPANFPTIRIAQFAALIHQSSGLFSKVLETKNMNDLKKLFSVQASSFWDTHYTFENKADKKAKVLGDIAFENIVINTVAPTLFFYGKAKNNEKYYEKAMEFLSDIKPENNHITKAWKGLGLKMEHAFDSQALIQLKNVYCKKRSCLKCSIGNQVIKHKV